MKHLLYLIFCLAAFPLKAQLLRDKIKPSAIYYYSVEKKDDANQPFLKAWPTIYGCTINLYESFGGMYNLDFDVGYTHDLGAVEMFSYGSYKESGNQIILTDMEHNYQMHLIRKKNTICFTKGLPWFINRCFTLEEEEERWNPDIHRYLIDINKLRLVNKKDHPKVITLSPGLYQSENYSLNLLPDHTYTLYFNKIKLMSGLWETKNGEVILHLKDNSTVFYLHITEQGLLSQLLPGDHKGVLLEKYKKDSEQSRK